MPNVHGLPEQLKALVDQLVTEQDLKLRTLAAENAHLRSQLEFLQPELRQAGRGGAALPCGGGPEAPAPLGVPNMLDVDSDSDSDDSSPRPLPHSIGVPQFPVANQTLQDSAVPVKVNTPESEESQSTSGGWWPHQRLSRRSYRSWSWKGQWLSTACAVEKDLVALREEEEGVNQRQHRLATAHQDAREVRKSGARGMMLKRRMSVIPTGEISPRRQRVLDLLSWWPFDALMGLVIMANSATIGIETTYAVQGLPIPVSCKVFENLFLVMYIVELGLRFYGFGKQALQSHWVKFDTFLVVSGLLDLILQVAFRGTSGGLLDQVMLVRMLRLCRLIRAVRLVVQFRTLYLLVQGLFASTVSMFWVFVVIVFVVYVFAIFGMELHSVDGNFGEEYEIITAANFQSIGDAMMALLQLITLDSVAGIYRPLIKVRPVLAIFFLSFILLCSISLMNLVTAITVESALRQASEDQEAQKAWEEMKRKELAPKLKALFETLDLNGDGEIEMHEIKAAPDEVKDQLLRICNMHDLEETFQMLDYDNSGALDIAEFCDGIMRLRADKPIELLRIVKQGADILRLLRVVAAQAAERRGDREAR